MSARPAALPALCPCKPPQVALRRCPAPANPAGSPARRDETGLHRPVFLGSRLKSSVFSGICRQEGSDPGGTRRRAMLDQRKRIAATVRDYIARERLSREQFAFKTKLGKSTVDKLLTGRFSDKT